MLSAAESSSGLKAGIVGDRASRPLDHAEGGEARLLQRRLLSHEEGVCGVRAGITALDVVDAELVQHGHDAPLVLEREIDARRLRAVAQRRVEQIEAFLAHRHAFLAEASGVSAGPSFFFMVVFDSHWSSSGIRLRWPAT